jgi:hypothetical protein
VLGWTFRDFGESFRRSKEVQVFDYVDSFVPMLARMFKKRRAGYEALGYSIS